MGRKKKKKMGKIGNLFKRIVPHTRAVCLCVQKYIFGRTGKSYSRNLSKKKGKSQPTNSGSQAASFRKIESISVCSFVQAEVVRPSVRPYGAEAVYLF